jgi:hypothetical protein
MSGRRRRFQSQNELDWPLPWQIELACGIIGLICVPLGMCWFVQEITSPATMLGQIFNVRVDVEPILTALRPMVGIFGVIVGWRVRCWLRCNFVRRLNRCPSYSKQCFSSHL